MLLALKKMVKSGATGIPAKMEVVEQMMGEVDTDGDGQVIFSLSLRFTLNV